LNRKRWRPKLWGLAPFERAASEKDGISSASHPSQTPKGHLGLSPSHFHSQGRTTVAPSPSSGPQLHPLALFPIDVLPFTTLPLPIHQLSAVGRMAKWWPSPHSPSRHWACFFSLSKYFVAPSTLHLCCSSSMASLTQFYKRSY
jgi:hypothetical protein